MSMVNIKVNDKNYEVESSANLLVTLNELGYNVPHFCHHEELGVAGNCRMCLVDVGKKRPQIACDTPITEGLHVKLNSEITKKVQRSIMEFELVNHPIDCSVCDQVGECSLQDYYMDHDLSKTRVKASNKVKKEKRLDYGSGVIHDQERCVLCTRCVRFTQKITKTDELAVVNRGNEARIGIFPGKPIDNRYAQCIVDVCPVGAMTSEDFRFKKRVFRLSSKDSICHECSKGCNIHIDHEKEKYKSDEIYRYRPRRNDDINGHFMCDHGRYSYKEENSHINPTYTINSEPVLKTEAVTMFLKEYKNSNNTLFIVSNSSSLEELYVINKLVLDNPTKYSITAYDEHIKSNDGDGYLIQDDKTANRESSKLLNIPMDKADFIKKIDNAKLIILCDVKNFDLLTNQLENRKVISLSSRNKNIINGDLTLYVKPYSQKSGIVINCDRYIQKYSSAVVSKDTYSVLDILNLAESSVDIDLKLIRDEISKSVKVFHDIDLNSIPSLGKKL